MWFRTCEDSGTSNDRLCNREVLSCAGDNAHVAEVQHQGWCLECSLHICRDVVGKTTVHWREWSGSIFCYCPVLGKPTSRLCTDCDYTKCMYPPTESHYPSHNRYLQEINRPSVLSDHCQKHAQSHYVISSWMPQSVVSKSKTIGYQLTVNLQL